MPKSMFSQNYQTLIALLAAERRAAGITQAQLASQLGKPQSFVAKVEGGERRLDVIEFIAITEAINGSPVQIFSRLSDQITRPLDI